jgi:hypothetical protein
MEISIYPSGSIRKQYGDQRLIWGAAERRAISTELIPHVARFFAPHARVPYIDQPDVMFGRDMYQLRNADFIVVDARERRGIGVGVEMMAARQFNKPVLVVCPSNSHYRRDRLDYRESVVANYLHPHLCSLADVVLEDFSSAGRWIAEFLRQPRPVRGCGLIDAAISRYTECLLKHDSQFSTPSES